MKLEKKLVVRSSVDKISTQIGSVDTLNSAPVGAFGFLPAKAVPVQAPKASFGSASKPASTKDSAGAIALTSLAPVSVPKIKSGGQLLSTTATLAAPSQGKSTRTPGTPSGPEAPVPSAFASGASQALAQAALLPGASVVLDNTLGQTGQPTITTNVFGMNDYEIDSGLGKFISGGNLYFSFSQFGLLTFESATFTNNAGVPGIRNILARVAGGGVSNIDGTINVNIPGANLFLMNASGFAFGPNASVNVPGAFTITTADYLKLADGKRFTALPGTDDASLSSAPVSAFGFLSGKPAGPAPVTMTGGFYILGQNSNLSIVAGDQTLSGTFLIAPRGQVELVSVRGSGEVPAAPGAVAATPFEELPELGAITLDSSALVSVESFGAGGSENEASSILVRSDSLLLSGGAALTANATGSGKGAAIDIQARSITLTDAGFLPSKISSASGDAAIGGNIAIMAESLSIEGSFIQTSAFSTGAAGNISITAHDVSITGSTSFLASGILAESGGANPGGQSATARGGDIHLVTEGLALANGGQISTTTYGPGEGGNVSVTAKDISISGFSAAGNGGAGFQSGIFARSALPGEQGRGGNGGSVTVSANNIRISADGLISASTVGSGDGGSVAIGANSITVDGTGATHHTGITATTSYLTGGKSGDISIGVASLTILGGGEINAATQGSGAGGSIALAGGSITVSGPNSIITAQTTAANGGAGGSLLFNVDSITLLDAGQISASTQGSGKGGSIEITANQITVDGGSIRAETSGKNGVVITDPSAQDIHVTVTIEYDPNSELSLSLINPAGNGVFLFNSFELAGSNLTDTTFSDTGSPISAGAAPYTGTFQPLMPLGLLESGAANGTWQLQVVSGFGSGTLVAWSVTVNGKQFASSAVPQPIDLFSFPNIPTVVSLASIQTQVHAGTGGSISLTAGTVNLRNGGTVTASTHGDGAAGSLSIQADSVTIDASRAGSDTGFFASALTGSTGHGGSISVSARTFQATGNSNSGIAGGVVARSLTAAPAGDILLQTRDVALDSHAVISSANLGEGPAGSVNITADNSIVLQGGSVVTVVSQAANAGTISLTAEHDIELHDNSTITAAAGAGGGSIMIKAGHEFFLDHSSIVATAGAGAGGNNNIDPDFIILDHGLISANALGGAGGNILIEGKYFFASESPITATGTTAGTVQITTLPLDLVNALAGLQGGFIDVSTALQDRCAMRLGTDFSSFLVVGRGGVEDSPDEPQSETADRLRQKAKGKVRGR